MPQFNPNNPKREEYDADHRRIEQRLLDLEARVGQAASTTPTRRTPGTIVPAPQSTSIGGNTSSSSPSSSLLTVSSDTTSYPNVPNLIFTGGWTITQDGATGAVTVDLVGIDDSP